MTLSAVLSSFPDRKSTRLNSSHSQISYAVFCLKKKSIDNSESRTSVLATLFSSLLCPSPSPPSRCSPPIVRAVPSSCCVSISSSALRPPPELHSFPTRRSSDLGRTRQHSALLALARLAIGCSVHE